VIDSYGGISKVNPSSSPIDQYGCFNLSEIKNNPYRLSASYWTILPVRKIQSTKRREIGTFL
jgi:hypothetical protein